MQLASHTSSIYDINKDCYEKSISLLSIALFTALSGCGGSSDGDNIPVTNLAPTLTIQAPDSALSMQSLSLTATAIDP